MDTALTVLFVAMRRTLDALVEAIVDLVPDLVAANLPDAQVQGGAPIPVQVHHVVNARSLSAA